MDRDQEGAMQTDPIIEKTIEFLHAGWTQGQRAEDENGDDCCFCDDPKAVAWCLTGAVEAAMLALGYDRDASKEEGRLFTGTLYRIALAGGFADDDFGRGIVRACESWNDDDDRTTEDIVLACKLALAGG
jgi:hypothetical protein